jgi:mRNA interferase MazF
MRRGEVWWAEFDERRPVVLLSGEDPSGFRAMQVVAPADTDISGLGTEVAVGLQEGLPFDGVLRFAFPRPGFTPCTWLTTLSREDLIERAGAVSAAKLGKIDDALRASQQTAEWTPPPRPGSARSRTPSAGELRQTDKERTPTPAKAGLLRTISGPWPLNNKITIYGWSTSEASLGPPRWAAWLGGIVAVGCWLGSGPSLPSGDRGVAARLGAGQDRLGRPGWRSWLRW